MGYKDIETKGFVYPYELERMSVKRALDYFDLAYFYGHGYIFEKYYDFARTLIIQCGIDGSYVLDNYGSIISRAMRNDGTLEKDLDDHFVEDSVDNRKYFDSLLREYQSNLDKKEREQRDKEKCSKEAQDRYSELKFMKKVLYSIKYGRPTQRNFSKKTTEEIKTLYLKK